MEDLFRDYWWLVFPLFGMVMAILGVTQEDRRIDTEIARYRRNLEAGQ